MIPGESIVATLQSLGITHAVYLPDAVMGEWEAALEASPDLRLVRVCREGEAWPLAFGLKLGGAEPIVIMQSTGLFESGDALRNALFDMQTPLYALIGYRSYLNEKSTDTAKMFTEPILNAWGLDQALITTADDLSKFAEHYCECREAGRPGVTLLAEGRM